MPRIPLLGVDWLGMLMWGATCLSLLFVCIYGEHYDWWQSEHIRFATLFGISMLALTLLRASFIRHPYIMIKTMRMPIVPLSILGVLLANILLAPSHICEHLLMENILGYDHLHATSLNWVSLVGIVMGALFTWQSFAVRKWTYQRMLVIGFSLLGIYLGYFYFVIDYSLPKEALYFPVFTRCVAQIIISTTLLTSITRLPFPFHFTQGVTLHNMFSSVLAGNIGTALVGRLFKVSMTRNTMWLSEGMDHVNQDIRNLSIGNLYGMIQVQALVESMKEVYGWLLFVAILCLMGLMMRYSSIRPRRVIEPTYRVIYKFIRTDVRRHLRIRQRSQHPPLASES